LFAKKGIEKMQSINVLIQRPGVAGLAWQADVSSSMYLYQPPGVPGLSSWRPFTGCQVRQCLDGKWIAFIGDSVTRYQARNKETRAPPFFSFRAALL
jgi:hypothetical protein